MLLITDGFPRNLGYLEIDQRNVEAPLPPGTPRHFEADTYTCSHCQFVVKKNPDRQRERYKCTGCNHHICDNCEAKRFAGAPCVTFAQRVEEYMEQIIKDPYHPIELK